VVVGVGDIELALHIEVETGGSVERGIGCCAAVAGEIFIAVAGDGGDCSGR
jgi:hypothetical protein